MNEVEQAIKHFEGLQKRYTTQHNGKHCEFVKTALSTLYEKQEREKGCEYCADREDLAFGHDSMKRVGSIYIDGNVLVADLYSESMAVAVCYCPMCGKSLKEVK